VVDGEIVCACHPGQYAIDTADPFKLCQQCPQGAQCLKAGIT